MTQPEKQDRPRLSDLGCNARYLLLVVIRYRSRHIQYYLKLLQMLSLIVLVWND